MTGPHLSVLKKEIIEIFANTQLRVFIDATLGAGGHSEAILTNHPEIERFIGVDQDPNALKIASSRLIKWKDKIELIQSNFDDLIPKIDTTDGILMDLGVSSMQIDQPERGFSFMKDGPLDMRMNTEADLTAEEVVNTWTEKELGIIFRKYGEEKKWRKAAATIVENRPFQTTQELVNTLRPLFPLQKGRVHPLTRIFQALRICVNRELEVLQNTLPVAIDKLNPGGRLAVMSFHSLEDRIVKNSFRYAASDKELTSGIGGVFIDKDPIIKLITRKPIIPTKEEQESNPRSRSAKLRVVEKL